MADHIVNVSHVHSFVPLLIPPKLDPITGRLLRTPEWYQAAINLLTFEIDILSAQRTRFQKLCPAAEKTEPTLSRRTKDNEEEPSVHLRVKRRPRYRQSQKGDAELPRRVTLGSHHNSLRNEASPNLPTTKLSMSATPTSWSLTDFPPLPDVELPIRKSCEKV